jgi:hypothetical protein
MYYLDNRRHTGQLLACIYSMGHHTYSNDLSLFALLQQQHQLEDFMNLLSYYFISLRVIFWQLLFIIQFLFKVWHGFLLHIYSRQFFCSKSKQWWLLYFYLHKRSNRIQLQGTYRILYNNYRSNMYQALLALLLGVSKANSCLQELSSRSLSNHLVSKG